MANRLLKLLVIATVAFIASMHLAFCQPALPPDPFAGAFDFESTNWLSLEGYAPMGFSNLVSVSVWNRNVLLLDTGNLTPAFLNYAIIEGSNEYTNLTFSFGAFRAAFICDWASADTNQNGTGPGDWSYLVGAGDFSSGSPEGLWRVYIDPGGTNLYFGGVSNATETVFVSAPISWASNSMHLLGATYSGTNSVLYVDGQTFTGSPVTIVPATHTWTNGFFVGSDASGYEQARGVFWYLEFFNSNVFEPDWSDILGPSYFTNSWNYLSNGYSSWLAAQGGGFHFDYGDGFSLPPNPTNSVNTNYADYTNFWLTITNNGSHPVERGGVC